MAVTPSFRPTREWPLLVLALVLVGAICIPLWPMFSDQGSDMWSRWDADRWARLLLGPEQIACYCAFLWAGLILFSRYLEVRRQRKAFHLPLLPTEDGSRILHEDARPLLRRTDQVLDQQGPLILGNMIRMALSKYDLSHSAREAAETVRTQAEVDQGRLVTGMATVHYLAWAIPALGFLGTVRGLAGSLTMAGQDLDPDLFIRGVTNHLNVAFDCTLIALVLSLGVMFLLHSVQREEDALVIDCQQYCLEHLVNRIYEPESLPDARDGPAYNPSEAPSRSAPLPTRGPRVTS